MASSSSAVLYRNVKEPPQQAVGGEGSYLVLDDGRKILDATGGAAVACLGHGHPDVKRAMAEQIDKLSYTHTAFFTIQPFEELAELLVESTERKMSRLYIISSGKVARN